MYEQVTSPESGSACDVWTLSVVDHELDMIVTFFASATGDKTRQSANAINSLFIFSASRMNETNAFRIPLQLKN